MISDERLAEARGHTPGPWRVGTHGGDVVCDTPIPEVGGADSVEYYGGHLVSESSTKANARLIAAAPELLDTIAELKAKVARWEQLKGELQKWLADDESGSESSTAIEYLLRVIIPDIERRVR